MGRQLLYPTLTYSKHTLAPYHKRRSSWVAYNCQAVHLHHVLCLSARHGCFVSVASSGPSPRSRRCLQEQRFVAFMREAEARRQAKLAAALAAAAPPRHVRSREEADSFYSRLSDDTARRRQKRCAINART